jgi:peptidyl-prolyl cis-trans isomerase D
MPVMHKMRENTHIILFFLLIMFLLSMTIGGLVGGADITHLFSRRPDTILSVNGESISYQQYIERRQQYFDYYRQQNNKEPQGYELQQLEDEIWESFIREMLLQQFAHKAKIGVTNSEIRYYIFDDPSIYSQAYPYFRDKDGKFDLKTYQGVINDERYLPLLNQYEMDLRRMIPSDKINQQIGNSIFITDDEVKQEFIKRNQKIRVKYLVFNSTDYKVEDSAISQQDIEAYYNEHKENYKEDETRKIEYVLFDVVPTASDTSDALFQAEMLMDSLKQGIDFAHLAETYSDDPGSAQKGGDLDYFARGVMVKPFEDAAFGAKIGDLVGPIITQHGIHIIKIEDKKVEDSKEEVRARHILLKINPSRNTYDTSRDNANNFVEVAKKEGFNITATTEKLKVDTTNFFGKGGVIPGLGIQKLMVDGIFHAKIGKISRVHYIENRGYVVYQVIDIKNERIKPLSEVEQLVKNAVRREKQKTLAEQAAQQFRTKIQAPQDFETLAEQDSLNIVETDLFTLSGYGRNVVQDANFKGAAFGLEVDEVSSVVTGTRGSYVIKMVEKQDFDAAAFNSQKESIRNELLQQKQRAAYTNWYDNLKKLAKIKDYRYMFL